MFTLARIRVEFHHHAAARRFQLHQAGLRELLGEVQKRRRAVIALRECRIELQERALEQTGLRRYLTVGQNLERAPDDWKRLGNRRAGRRRRRPPGPCRRLAHAAQVFVRDELVAVALQDHARKGAPADDEDFLVVLLEFLDERQEVAVAADDDVSVDVLVGERHFERVERHVDVGAVLVAARRQVALHEADGVLRQMPTVVAGARPVGVGDLADDLSALFDGLEHVADVELLTEGVFDSDLDVVEVDEYRDVQSFLVGSQIQSFGPPEGGHYVRCYVLRVSVERRRCVRRRPHDTRELAALQELAPLAAAAGDFVLRGADRLFSAAAGFDREDVAISGRRDEAEHSVLFAELDEQHALAGAGQVVHFLGLRQDAAALGGGRNEDLTSSVTCRAHNLRVFRRPGKPAAGPGARLDQALEAEPQRKPVAADSHAVHRRRVAFLLRLDVADRPRIQTERADDPFAILQLELLLNRFAVAGRGRYVDYTARIRDAEVGEEHARRPRAASERGQHGITLAQPCRRQVLHVLLALHPAVARHDHDVVFLDDEVVGAVLGFGAVAGDEGPPLVAVLRADLFELSPDEFPPALFVAQQRGDLAGALALLFEFVPDDEDLEPGEAVDLQLEDRVSLLRVELEPLHDFFGGVGLPVRLADDLDDLVERVEDLFEAFEDVEAFLECRQLVLEASGDDLQPEVEEVPEDLLEVEPFRASELRVLGRD